MSRQNRTQLVLGILLVLLAAYATWFLLYKTTIGYEIRAIGYTANIGMETPRAQGINISRRIVQLMTISGALAGLGGCFFILGMQYQFPGTAIADQLPARTLSSVTASGLGKILKSHLPSRA